MRFDRVALALIAAALSAAPAAAQTTGDDVRCYLLSASYARLATKDDNLRRAASMTGAFYLGRLNGRVSDAALAAAIHAQGTGMSGKEAAPIMRACSARAGAAEQAMAAAARKAAGPPGK